MVQRLSRMAAHTQLGLKENRLGSQITMVGHIAKKVIKAIVKSGHPYQVLTEKNDKVCCTINFGKQNFRLVPRKSEFGPRALGNRSILANPTSLETKYVLDHYMKSRDRYRPYAPVVIEELAGHYFDSGRLQS